ncbi:tRNA (guanosine(37)-N1)-methyltransferase TrmD [Candidatus Falkowbacteria bacterium]|nr:tRNA (guanosine(37)-N1)-methyltransferase TrmD [Candidatus Falkowbacteria bacterium]
MLFNIITIFPDIFDSYFAKAMVKRAQLKKLIQIKITDLRHYAGNKYKSVDDTPYGGGAGMILKIEPIFKALKSIKRKKKSRVILFSAHGKTLTQKDLRRLKKYDQLIMICGRYEGVDNRVAEKIADEEISIGNYVLTGGEIPAMVLIDGITRLLPGVLGNLESPKDESFSKEKELEYPQYTKPENFKGWKVPRILLSGHHGKIREWREKRKKMS